MQLFFLGNGSDELDNEKLSIFQFLTETNELNMDMIPRSVQHIFANDTTQLSMYFVSNDLPNVKFVFQNESKNILFEDFFKTIHKDNNHRNILILCENLTNLLRLGDNKSSLQDLLNFKKNKLLYTFFKLFLDIRPLIVLFYYPEADKKNRYTMNYLFIPSKLDYKTREFFSNFCLFANHSISFEKILMKSKEYIFNNIYGMRDTYLPHTNPQVERETNELRKSSLIADQLKKFLLFYLSENIYYRKEDIYRNSQDMADTERKQSLRYYSRLFYSVSVTSFEPNPYPFLEPISNEILQKLEEIHYYYESFVDSLKDVIYTCLQITSENTLLCNHLFYPYYILISSFNLLVHGLFRLRFYFIAEAYQLIANALSHFRSGMNLLYILLLKLKNIERDILPKEIDLSKICRLNLNRIKIKFGVEINESKIAKEIINKNPSELQQIMEQIKKLKEALDDCDTIISQKRNQSLLSHGILPIEYENNITELIATLTNYFQEFLEYSLEIAREYDNVILSKYSQNTDYEDFFKERYSVYSSDFQILVHSFLNLVENDSFLDSGNTFVKLIILEAICDILYL